MWVPINNFCLDFDLSYKNAANYCASQDRCISEVKSKLQSWSVDKSFFNKIISKLTDEGFMDEERFATSYDSGKFRINGWGKRTIFVGLRSKSVPFELIDKALLTIDDDEYALVLDTLLNKKLKLLGDDTLQNKQKAAYFATSRGFEPELISKILGEMGNS